MQPSPQTPPQPPIRSEFCSDPEMREIVEIYVVEMPQRVATLTGHWEAQQLEELRRLAHQIKGASAGYGFPSIGSAAGLVEQTLVTLGNGGLGSSLDQLRKQVNDLISLCQRVSI